LDVGQKNFGNDQPASWTGSGVHDPTDPRIAYLGAQPGSDCGP
jgi:hypothetical protein